MRLQVCAAPTCRASSCRGWWHRYRTNIVLSGIRKPTPQTSRGPCRSCGTSLDLGEVLAINLPAGHGIDYADGPHDVFIRTVSADFLCLCPANNQGVF